MADLFSGWNFKTLALASAFFAGLTAIFGKLGVARINSNVATLVRTAVIMVMIALLLMVQRFWQRGDAASTASGTAGTHDTLLSLGSLPARDVLMLVLSALATGASWLCYYRALQLGPASVVAPLDKLSVVFAILLALVFLGEPASWRVLCGGALVTAGAVVLAW